MSGTAGAVTWRIENLTVQRDTDRTKWRYTVKLRDATGAGVRLTRLTVSYIGTEFTEWRPYSADIDVIIPPGGEVNFPCGRQLFPRTGGTMRNWSLTERREYTGQDRTGKSVVVVVEIPFGDVDPPSRSSILDFARFTASAVTNATLECESIPPEPRVFDPDVNDVASLLIGVDNVGRAVPVRTRWLSPMGEELKVIHGQVSEVSRRPLFYHITHSVSTLFMASRPGLWKVELFLDGQLQGVFAVEVGRDTARK